MSKVISLCIRVSVILFAGIGFIFVAGYSAISFGLTKTNGVIDVQTKNFIKNPSGKAEYTIFPLAHTPSWIAFRQAVAKDAKVIEKVSKETGIQPRLLVAILVPEQMRLFYSDRPLFKKVFEPLKILGSQSQFSWGIFGIKDETARATEKHLTDTTSPFYLGKSFESALSFENETNVEQERFTRITDEHNHYYSYLYTALYVAELEMQWKKMGYSLHSRPDIIATLWNLGFEKSKPNPNPSSGGSVLTIEEKQYSFGELAGLFYYSDEMIELFPSK